MPEFVMDTAGVVSAKPPLPQAWCDLDAFTQGYIEAMFFTETAHGVDRAEWGSVLDDEIDGQLPCDACFGDIAPETLAAIWLDCAAFQKANRFALGAAIDGPRDYDETAAGRDYWYTRNRHGTGYWDRGLGVTGDKLTDAAHEDGEVWVYWGADEKVYMS